MRRLMPGGDLERDRHTAIHKAPVVGCVAVARLNLDGDQQADLSP